ncbi:unnamed protein product [Sphagnum compactum]
MRSSSNAAAAAAARPIDPDPPAPNSDVKFLSLIKFHWTDWVCLVILIIIEIILEVIHPYKRYVGPKNFVTGELLYPMHSQTIPFYAVPIFSLIIPLVFILTYFFWRKSQRDVHHSILGLLTAVALTAVITDALKDGLGFPRPDFYARCFGSVTATPVNNNVACTGSPSQIKEGYKSFPSGHASWSFAGLGYLALYIAGKLGTFFDRRGHTVKLLPVILPLLLATFIAVTRVDNYWHHWFDGFAGGLLGLFVAYFCYRQHYPSLFDVEGSSPYPHNQRHPAQPLAAWPAHSSPSWEGPDNHV